MAPGMSVSNTPLKSQTVSVWMVVTVPVVNDIFMIWPAFGIALHSVTDIKSASVWRAKKRAARRRGACQGVVFGSGQCCIG